MHALRNGPLSAIPQSPVSGGGLKTGSPMLSDTQRDYFSLRTRTDPSPSRDGERKEPPTPGTSAPVAATPGTTPGGSSLMGRFKGFGKKKTLDTPMAPVQEQAPVAEDTVRLWPSRVLGRDLIQ